MPEGRGPRGWFGRLWRGRRDAAPTQPGRPALVSGLEAALSVARSACDTVVEGSDAGAIAAEACGLAMTGQRVGLFLPLDGLADALPALSEAARWHVPLVAVAHVQSDPLRSAPRDCFVLAARHAQDAADLLLVALAVAELTLTPGIVAIDAGETADAVLPEDHFVREWLGDPRASINSPSLAQQMLFGARRQRVPAWFDLDRPVSVGRGPDGRDAAAAAAGRELFFGEQVAAAVREAMQRLGELTGRPLAPLDMEPPEGRNPVLVAHGAAGETAVAVARRIGAQGRGARPGVCNVLLLRPLPVTGMREKLAGAEAVAVLDRGDGPREALPPFTSAVADALARDVRLLSVRVASGGPSAAELAAVFGRAAQNGPLRDTAWLGVAPPGRSSAMPKAEALSQRLAREAPDLARACIAADEPFDSRPDHARTVALHAAEDRLPRSALRGVAQVLGEHVGSHVRSRCASAGRGAWRGHVTASPGALLDPGRDPVSELLLVVGPDPEDALSTLATAGPAARVIIAAEAPNDGAPAGIPAAWRGIVAARGLRCFTVIGTADDLLAALPAWLDGVPGDAVELVEARATQRESASEETQPPLAVRRYGASGEGYRNVARFHGEHVQPRLAEPGRTPFADPFLALGATPPATAGLADATGVRTEAPVVDPSLCSACGRCWVSCPDAAIAPVALGSRTLLDAAADCAGLDSRDKTIGRLRRAFRQLGARIDARLAGSGTRALSAELLQEELSRLLDTLAFKGDEQTTARTAADSLERTIATLPFIAAEPLFQAAHRASPGTGALLALAVDPHACVGCGVCAAVCPDDAIAMQPESPAGLARRAGGRLLFDALPDTEGRVIAAARDAEAIGPLAAVSLSRHCHAQPTGGVGDPGCGERIAVRQIAAVIEAERQRVALSRIEELHRLAERLRTSIQASMADAAFVEDLDRLDKALEDLPPGQARVSEVVTRLEEEAQRDGIEIGPMQRLVRTTREIERLARQVEDGTAITGRARYGVVVASPSIESWASAFGENPFTVPVAASSTDRVSDLAAGLARGLVRRHVEEVRLVRRAELIVEAPADLEERLDALENLSITDLSAAERAGCPPLVVLCDSDAFADSSAGRLMRLLASGLPLKIVVLDGRDIARGGPDVSLAAIAVRDAYVVATSIAHGQHLFEGVRGALSSDGAALVHIHAPSPLRHGFPAERTVERARLAVEARVHPLLRYDPAADGVFGSRLSLDGNPGLEATLADDESGRPFGPAEWALGETRFSASRQPPGDEETAGEDLARAAARTIESWRTLQELAGVDTPFTERVRSRLAEELTEAHHSEVEAVRRGGDQRHLARLRGRLLALAGVSPRVKPDGGETADEEIRR